MPDLDPQEWLRALGQLIDLKVWGARVVLFIAVIIFFKTVVIPILELRRKK